MLYIWALQGPAPSLGVRSLSTALKRHATKSSGAGEETGVRCREFDKGQALSCQCLRPTRLRRSTEDPRKAGTRRLSKFERIWMLAASESYVG